MNITDTTVLASICYNAPTINPSVISFMQWGYWYLLIIGFICIGAAFALPPVMTFISIIVQTFLVYSLWLIMRAAESPRPPEILTMSNCQKAIIWYDALNLYGTPDPTFIPSLAFLAIYVYMFYRMENMVGFWTFIVILLLSLTAHTTFEFVLGRIYIFQYFVNLLIAALVAAVICILLHTFYEIEQDQALHILMSNMLRRLFTEDKKIMRSWVTRMNNRKYGTTDRSGKNGHRSSSTTNLHNNKNRATHWAIRKEARTFDDAVDLRGKAIGDFLDLFETLAQADHIETERIRRQRIRNWISNHDGNHQQ